MRQRMVVLISFMMIVAIGLVGCSDNHSSPDKDVAKHQGKHSSVHRQGRSDSGRTKTPHDKNHAEGPKHKSQKKGDKAQYHSKKKSSPTPKKSDPFVVRTKKKSGQSVADTVKKMTLDEKIGQMLLVGIDGKNMNSRTRTLIQKKHVGGVIFFSKNIGTPKQTVHLVNQLKRVNANAGNPLPLFLSVDEEGGQVSRMPDAILDIPSSGRIGKLKDSRFSFEIGESLGRELNAFGLNMDFAPVLDINNHSGKSVIGNRSFGSGKETVNQLGVATMKGIESQHVVSVIKHFPGYGAATTDAHTGLPKVDYNKDRLINVEWDPYKKAIENDANAVMVTHILLPKLGSHHPASLSKKVITGILRKKLQFHGVVITDDLTMGAIKKKMNVSNAAVQAVKAGADIAMVAFNPKEEDSAFRALKQAVKKGEISEKHINDSVARIIKLKKNEKLSNQPVNNVKIKQLNKRIKNVLDKKF